MKPTVQMVAAMAKDRTIAKGGRIPWRYPEDQRFFKVVTMGTALIMGRKTFVANGRILPGRDNIVITRDPETFSKGNPGAFAVPSLKAAMKLAIERGAKRISIIGGGEIYAQALPVTDSIILSYIPEKGGGDVFFPPFEGDEWKETKSEKIKRVRVRRFARVG